MQKILLLLGVMLAHNVNANSLTKWWDGLEEKEYHFGLLSKHWRWPENYKETGHRLQGFAINGWTAITFRNSYNIRTRLFAKKFDSCSHPGLGFELCLQVLIGVADGYPHHDYEYHWYGLPQAHIQWHRFGVNISTTGSMSAMSFTWDF